MPISAPAFWSQAAAPVPGLRIEDFYEAFRFGDSEALADELATLVLQGHFFGRECQRIGREPRPDMPVCERFRMVYAATVAGRLAPCRPRSPTEAPCEIARQPNDYRNP